MAPLKRAKRISSHTSFFKAGFCLGRVLVCIVKSSQLSSTFKTLEPIDQNVRGRAKPTFRKLLQGGNDTLKLFRVSQLRLREHDDGANAYSRSSTFPSSRRRSIT